MTFHDETQHDWEKIAYQSVRHLQLWLLTIAPIPPEEAKKVLTSLSLLCKEMRWLVQYDETLGKFILTQNAKETL